MIGGREEKRVIDAIATIGAYVEEVVMRLGRVAEECQTGKGSR